MKLLSPLIIIRKEIRVFAAALTYFTGFPLSFFLPNWIPSTSELGQCIRYLGVVGIGVGLFSGGIYLGSLLLWNPSVAAIFATIASLLATRGLHEDGLADFADGIGGGRFDSKQALKIMKDPCHGTFGVLALWSVLTLKWQFITASSNDSGRTVVALIFAHVFSRTASWFLAAWCHDARKITPGQGVDPSKSSAVLIQSTKCSNAPSQFLEGRRFTFLSIKRPQLPGLGIHGGLVLGLALWQPREGFFVLGVGLLFVLLFRRFLIRWLGGYTGDCLGACQQVVELIVLGWYAQKLL